MTQIKLLSWFAKYPLSPERIVDNVSPPKVWSNGRAMILMENEEEGEDCM